MLSSIPFDHDNQRLQLAQRLEGNWAMATTRRKDDVRRRDLAAVAAGDARALTIGEYRKASIVAGFFEATGADLASAGVNQVNKWIGQMRQAGLADATIAKRLALLSSFYRWLQKALGRRVINPVDLAERPTVTPYGSAKALPADQVAALRRHLQLAAVAGDVADVRDYALFMFFITTGRRRNEIIRLAWGDLYLGELPTMELRLKGGRRLIEEIPPAAKEALLAYIEASGRQADQLKPDSPLWLRHDRAAAGNVAMSSWAFDKRLKRAAAAVGIQHIHIHQLRHTVAALVDEAAGEHAAQEQLAHQNPATTRRYLAAIRVKRDRHSADILQRLEE